MVPREKKKTEHKQNLLIYFVCKAFDSRDLLSVKAQNRLGIVYRCVFAKSFVSKGHTACDTQY